MPKLGDAWVEVGARIGMFMKGMRKVGDTFKKVGTTLKRVGKRMILAISAITAAIATFSVKAFGDFDRAMTESLAIMGQVSDMMRKDMVVAAREMAKQTIFSAKALAEAYFFLASAGLNAEKAIGALPIVAKFAQAGVFNLSTATSLLAGSQAALGLKVKDATQNMINMKSVSDVLVKANTLADATTEQFGIALTRAGGTMRAFGVDLEEGVAVLGALAEVQRKAESGGEALSRVLRLMIPAAVKNAEAYDLLGIAVFNAEKNLRPLADIIEDMEIALEPLAVAEKSVALEALGFQRRMQGAILPLIGVSKTVRRFEAELRNAGGTTETVAKKQLLTFSNQMILLRNRIADVGIRIGETLAPAVLKISRFFTGLIEKFGKWLDQLKEGGIIDSWVTKLTKMATSIKDIGKTFATGRLKIADLFVDAIALLKAGFLDIIDIITPKFIFLGKMVGNAIATTVGRLLPEFIVGEGFERAMRAERRALEEMEFVRVGHEKRFVKLAKQVGIATTRVGRLYGELSDKYQTAVKEMKQAEKSMPSLPALGRAPIAFWNKMRRAEEEAGETSTNVADAIADAEAKKRAARAKTAGQFVSLSDIIRRAQELALGRGGLSPSLAGLAGILASKGAGSRTRQDKGNEQRERLIKAVNGVGDKIVDQEETIFREK